MDFRVLEALVSPADATARIAALEASLARANAALAARDLLIDTLRGQIARLRRMQFGASSENCSNEAPLIFSEQDPIEVCFAFQTGVTRGRKQSATASVPLC